MNVSFNSTTQNTHFIAIPTLYTPNDQVDEYVWDFGDGSSAFDPNPIHHYLIPGEYSVCLKIRTLFGCEANVCGDIYVDFCNIIVQATKQNVSRHGGNDGYIDLDINCCGIAPYSFLWADGDTTDYRDSLYAGVYMVTVTDVLGCTEGKSVNISEPPGIHGMVYAGNNKLPEGIAIAYCNKNNKIIAESYSYINSGEFTLTRYSAGNYYVYALPHFDFSLPFSPIYLPTYKSDSIKWEMAELFNNDSVLIHLKPIYDINLGAGRITGNIVYTLPSSYEIEVYGEDWYEINPPLYQNAAKNIPIILYDNDTFPVRYTLSDNNGNFEFSNIDYGNYIIYAEKAGYTTYPPKVTIDYINSEHNSSELYIGEGIINYSTNSINEISILDDVIIYPNPVNDYLQVDINNRNTSDIEIEIINELGETLPLLKSSIYSSNKLKIDLENFPNGLYFLKMKNDGYVVIKKFIISKD